MAKQENNPTSIGLTQYLDPSYWTWAAEDPNGAALLEQGAGAILAYVAQRLEAIGCEGLARVDFFLTDDGPVINEINTMPGFTTISMYPRMWAASGVEYPALLATMVETAVARGTGLR